MFACTYVYTLPYAALYRGPWTPQLDDYRSTLWKRVYKLAVCAEMLLMMVHTAEHFDWSCIPLVQCKFLRNIELLKSPYSISEIFSVVI